MSGPANLIDQAQAIADKQKIQNQKLSVTHAFHSRMLDPMVQPLIRQAKNIVYFLGSLVLILLSVYFVTGLLNISGTGLASLGKGTVIEGMTDDEKNAKALERTEKKLQGIVKQLDAGHYISIN